MHSDRGHWGGTEARFFRTGSAIGNPEDTRFFGAGWPSEYLMVTSWVKVTAMTATAGAGAGEPLGARDWRPTRLATALSCA